MATFTYEVPSEQLPMIEEAFCIAYGYQEEVDNPDYDPEVKGSKARIPNPQTPTDFTMAQVVQHIQNVVVSNASQKAQKAAQDQVAAATENLDLGTVTVEV